MPPLNIKHIGLFLDQTLGWFAWECGYFFRRVLYILSSRDLFRGAIVPRATVDCSANGVNKYIAVYPQT